MMKLKKNAKSFSVIFKVNLNYRKVISTKKHFSDRFSLKILQDNNQFNKNLVLLAGAVQYEIIKHYFSYFNSSFIKIYVM